VSDVKAETAGKPVPEQKKIEQQHVARVTTLQETGGLVGRFLLAVLAVRIVSRRSLLRVFQIPGLIVVPLVFALAPLLSLNALIVGVFFAGLFTVAQFSFWGNYLPRVYPMHLRGTGEGFAANIGGRMIGTSFAWVSNFIAANFYADSVSPATRMAYTAAGVALFVYLVGTISCFWLPEPAAEELPE
jgi:MFS family permease